jgi:RNA polymerase sigma-70 factor (ECF subfamily)
MPDNQQTRFPSLYAATLAPLRRYLARLLGSHNDAQDLAHDAYARVYQAMHVQPIERPETFLFTTARRLALNQIKRRQIAPISNADNSKIIEFTPAQTPGVDRLVMAREEWKQLESAIANLPPGCRQVLLLCKVEQQTHAEIGATLGIAVSTVEKQHARALRLLRAAMSDVAQTHGQDNTETSEHAAGN